MTNQLFLGLLLGIPTLFVLLDLADQFMLRDQRPGHAPLKRETILFLVAVLLVYAVIQYGLTALTPSAERLFGEVRQIASRLLNQPLDPTPIGGGWLLLLSLLLFYISGLWDYALHRWFSHSRPFWFTHEYHHLPSEVFTAAPGLAVRPFAIVTAFPSTVATVISAYGLLLLFGLPLWDLTPLKVLLLAYTFLLVASHSSFLRRYWVVHHTMKWLALTTPQEHVLHHAVDLNGNYGNFTVLWDRLFSTYIDPTLVENHGHKLGLAYDQDFLGAVTAGHVKLPPWMRERFQVERFCNIESSATKNQAFGKLEDLEDIG